MASLINSIIPEHQLYCEPFFGGGAVFFLKPKSKGECINDMNGHVVNFYRVCASDFPTLRLLVTQTPHSRKVHREAEFILKNPEAFSELRRAWAFWVQCIMSYSSKLLGGYAYDRLGKCPTTTDNKRLSFNKSIKDRLSRVDIECNDALKIIKSRDSSETFHYIDPPYFNSDCGHYKGYTEQDFKNLLECLQGLKGKFLLSSYPSELLQGYTDKNDWFVHSIQKKVAVTKHTDKLKTEVLTGNYDFVSILS